MIPKTPILPGFEQSIPETIIAKDQPPYLPLPAIIIPGPDGEVLTRWELTDQEKILLLSGGHIYLSQLTFKSPLQPILLRVATPQMIVDEQREIEFPKKEVTPDVITSDEVKAS